MSGSSARIGEGLGPRCYTWTAARATRVGDVVTASGWGTPPLGGEGGRDGVGRRALSGRGAPSGLQLYHGDGNTVSYGR